MEAAKGRKPRKKKAEPKSRGLAPGQVGSDHPPAKIEELQRAVAKDGGTALGAYRDPLGGHWQILAALPIEIVKPTPFQRDLSEAHVKRLSDKIDKLGRFLDPVIAVRKEGGEYWTPNGYHRLGAMEALGAKSIVALVLDSEKAAFQILAMNTEKAHNLREKSLEAIRMARELAKIDPRAEKDYALELEEPAFLTLGLCYEQNGRFSGGAYQPVLRRTEEFLGASLSKALEVRKEHAAKLFELDEAVVKAVKELKDRGFQSPYLKAFVVARVNPLRFQRKARADFDETIEKMLSAAKRFDASKIRADQLAASGGPPED